MLFIRFRFILYTLAGIVSALFGLTISQILIVDIGQFLKETNFFKEYLNKIPLDLIVLPIMAGCLAFAMVGVEMYSSSPTRYQLKSFNSLLPYYLRPAIRFGFVTGLFAAMVSWALYSTDIPSGWVRVIAWTLIGLFIGLGESISWRLRSIEGQTSQAKLRQLKTVLFGLFSGLFSAILIEVIRDPVDLKEWEDVIGFLLLGSFLGASLSIGTLPNYQAALRAGRGFEFYDDKTDKELPKLQNQSLRFVTEDIEEDEDQEMIIEEGLSIELPSSLEKTLTIGSQEDADIYIPNIPERCANISCKNGKYMIRCLVESKVEVNQDQKTKNEKSNLIHNQIITFYHANNSEEFYRFVFYNRILDPQA